MEVNYFQILPVDVTFYLYLIENVVLNVLIKNENPSICGPAVKGLSLISASPVCFNYYECLCDKPVNAGYHDDNTNI